MARLRRPRRVQRRNVALEFIRKPCSSARWTRPVTSQRDVPTSVAVPGQCAHLVTATNAGRDGALAPSAPRSAAQRCAQTHAVGTQFRPLNAAGDIAARCPYQRLALRATISLDHIHPKLICLRTLNPLLT